MITDCTTYDGELKGITSSTKFRNGALKACMLNQENCLETAVGRIIPQFRTATFGERQKKHRSAIDFFQSGQIKSVALQTQMPIETPIGTIGAELVTFYEDGSLNRVFPLNGKIDGFWSEANERSMADTTVLELPVGKVSAKAISIHFYPSGRLKTLTVWPGEKLSIETPLGPINGRAGFSLYENGAVRSVEPWVAAELPTPIGLIKAFDPDIIGMHADQNSVQFSEDGTLKSLKTVHTGIKVMDAGGVETIVQPHEAPSFIDPSKLRTVPIVIAFSADSLRIEAKKTYEFPLQGCTFSTFEMPRVLREMCTDCPEDETCCQNGGDSGGCSGCGGH